MRQILLFLLLITSIALSAQVRQTEVPVPADSKEALEAAKKNKQIRRRARARVADDPNTRLRLANRGLNQGALSYNYSGVRKERDLFQESGKYSEALLDVVGYLMNDKEQPVKIAAGDKVQILKKKKKRFKVKYRGRKLFVDRQFYVAEKE